MLLDRRVCKRLYGFPKGHNQMYLPDEKQMSCAFVGTPKAVFWRVLMWLSECQQQQDVLTFPKKKAELCLKTRVESILTNIQYKDAGPHFRHRIRRSVPSDACVLATHGTIAC